MRCMYSRPSMRCMYNRDEIRVGRSRIRVPFYISISMGLHLSGTPINSLYE